MPAAPPQLNALVSNLAALGEAGVAEMLWAAAHGLLVSRWNSTSPPWFCPQMGRLHSVPRAPRRKSRTRPTHPRSRSRRETRPESRRSAPRPPGPTVRRAPVSMLPQADSSSCPVVRLHPQAGHAARRFEGGAQLASHGSRVRARASEFTAAAGCGVSAQVACG